MPSPKVTEAEFIEIWRRYGSVSKVATALGITERGVSLRRARLEKTGVSLGTQAAPGYESRSKYLDTGFTFPRVKPLHIDTGAVIIFSDAHYWPGEPSLAHIALVEAIKVVKPRVVIANGDIFDGVSVSRHDPFGWHEKPSVKEELEVCQERLHEIELTVPRGCELVWNIGNHDVRFERNLCAKVPEFAGLNMMRLEDHFSAWDLRWSTFINEHGSHPFMVKHRFAGGIHAAYNNTMKGGVSIATGHTHILEVKPWGDYRGRRYGVQTGTLADVNAPAFEYQENSPSSACSGFVVVTFRDGQMLHPELCEVIGNRALFRGQVIAEAAHEAAA